MAVWHLLQAFLAKFPEYNPPGGNGFGVNLFAESYGGKYGPVFADVWSKQNEKRRSNELPRNSTLEINLAALGIINGCVDDLIQTPSYPAFANGNTYGFQGFSSVLARHINASLYSNDGCLDLIEQCRTAQGLLDPDNTGGIDSVNSQCSSAYTKCYKDSVAPFADSGRSFYDIASTSPDSFPPSTYIEYLNQPSVQKAIGAVTNFTSVNPNVMNAFLRTGDFVRGPLLPGIAALLSAGVRVALVYGDRDYICNWMGGEAIADAIAQQSPDTYGARYEEAGHAPIIVNDSYIGGVVRQYGNLSFSRIYQAGHAVPAYQPETALQVFARIVMGTSISTGDKVDLATYMTEGDSSADEHKDDLPDAPSATCWIRNKDSCSSDQMQMLKDGEGVVINGVLYSAASEWPLATRTTASSTTTSTTSATNTEGDPSTALSADLTGVYTATSTPDNAANSGPLGRARSFAIFTAIGVMIWTW
jgi:carboxypeptidase C (cathepsin A)